MADPRQLGAPGTPGWQYPVANPLTALLNALRSQGRFINPFFGPGMSRLKDMAGGLRAQFFGSQIGQPGDIPEGQTLESLFGDFLGGQTTGRSMVAPWGMGQARGFLDALGGLMQRVTSMAGGLGLDPNDLEAMKKAMLEGGFQDRISERDLSLAGLFLGDPKAQQDIYGEAFGPSLGPTLSRGLDTVSTAQKGLWDQLLGESTFQAGQPVSFLDMLMGRLGQPYTGPQWGPGTTNPGGAGAGPTGAGYTPGMTSAQALSPGLEQALQPAPSWSSEFDTPRGRGHVPSAGIIEPMYQQMLGAAPQEPVQQSLLQRLLELLMAPPRYGSRGWGRGPGGGR